MLGALLLCFGTASVAAADPILLTSGGVTVYDDGSATIFSGSGSGFSAFGSGFGDGFTAGFKVGDTVNISQSISWGPTFGTPGGVTVGGAMQNGYLAGNLQLNATPFVAGNVISPTFGLQTFSTPFTLTGSVEFLSKSGEAMTPVLTQDVTASGTAEFAAKNIGSGQFLVPSDPTMALGLTFSNTSPPVTPEPSTMLLLGTGVVGLWQARRLRRAR